jgi:hypothetical protein
LSLSDEDKAAVKTAVEVAMALKPKGKHIVWIEEKLNLEVVDMKTGKVDLAYFDAESQSLCVVDHKFGKGPVPDPTDNKQLQAYSLALVESLKKQGFEVLQAYLVISQPCGTVRQSYKDALFPAQVFPAWRNEIKDALKACQAKDPPATPGVHCKRSFCEAGKHGACPEFKAYSDGKSVEREELSTRTAAFAVSGLSPVIVEGPTLSFPIIVISDEAITRAEDFRLKAQDPVVDQHSANTMGLLLNDITKFEGQMVKNLKEVKKPLAALEDRIDEACAKGLTPLREAKAHAKGNLDGWIKKNNDEREEAIERAKEQIAANKADVAAGAEITTSVPVIPEPVKIAGVNVKKVPEFEILDWDAMPEMFKKKGVEEVMLKKAIESKKVTEKDTWLEIKWVDKSQSTGRRG